MGDLVCCCQEAVLDTLLGWPELLPNPSQSRAYFCFIPGCRPDDHLHSGSYAMGGEALKSYLCK
ncbi:hypothetical protein CHS0354_033548, partial [Potamilus streckersoni]